MAGLRREAADVRVVVAHVGRVPQAPERRAAGVPEVRQVVPVRLAVGVARRTGRVVIVVVPRGGPPVATQVLVPTRGAAPRALARAVATMRIGARLRELVAAQGALAARAVTPLGTVHRELGVTVTSHRGGLPAVVPVVVRARARRGAGAMTQVATSAVPRPVPGEAASAVVRGGMRATSAVRRLGVRTASAGLVGTRVTTGVRRVGARLPVASVGLVGMTATIVGRRVVGPDAAPVGVTLGRIDAATVSRRDVSRSR